MPRPGRHADAVGPKPPRAVGVGPSPRLEAIIGRVLPTRTPDDGSISEPAPGPLTWLMPINQPVQISINKPARQHGMMIAVPEGKWEEYEVQSAPELGQTLLGLAEKVKVARLRKHPRKPKKKTKKGDVPGEVARRHIATA
ncbi:hypothetical protein [Archangium sp.]|uniref:hypothetical protein n=1 Tax=Archangium sp. TaxID=1872627 RepID=UPI002D6FD6B9|nr:hypothetical protein [Archangium sp.]HYO58687.1 hypothetical protein [Archangium sp.]